MRVRALSLSLVIIGIFAALVPVTVGAQSPNTFASFTVTDIITGAPVVGGTFTTDLQISITNSAAPEVGVVNVEVWIPFDSSIVAVKDFDDHAANGTQVEIKNGFFDGNMAIGTNEVLGPNPGVPHPPGCDTRSCVHIAVGRSGDSGPVSNRTGTVATITWSALATGSPNINVAVVSSGIPPGSVLKDVDGQPIRINNVSVPTINVTGASTIEGVVLRQGSQADHAGTEVVGMAMDGRIVATATTAANGQFTLVVPQGGAYSVRAGRPGYLRSQKASIRVERSTVDIGSTKLQGGDVNADCCVNILDIVSIISKFDLTELPPNDSEDINADGTVDLLDLTIAAGNFTNCGPTAWVP